MFKIKIERMRVTEALAARDTVVHRLEDAYISVRQKAATIDRLQRELGDLKYSSNPTTSEAGERVLSTQIPVQQTAITSEIQQPVLVEAHVENGGCIRTSDRVVTLPLVRHGVLIG